ncbi:MULTISPECIES: peptidoglycan DD-metalloendopeptidase family protein [unclassified Pseudomonas]|uniref:peptidoglycan DD-metalloendopeptidase family protein n=1 Tax=unclassified Pseudomonas TaxID=196821 RepID=UPI0025F51E10|nr:MULTISPECIES: peptidoglycan DD-metalloendopeptidase family protein [unclassified Pseudomonas]
MFERLLVVCALLMAAQAAEAVTIYRFTDANGVVSFTDQPVPGAQVMKLRERMVEHIDAQVRLNVKKAKGTDSLYVRNDLYAPVEIELKLSGVKNVVGVADQVIRRTVPARSNQRLIALSPITPGKAMAYRPSLRSIIGDPQSGMAGIGLGYRYPLPWVGGPFRISQGPNGAYSHVGARSRYAIDIAMPEGTQIIAARSGTVIKTENTQTGRGANPSGNFVRILHDDGTMGVYLHLQQGSVSVKEGERVAVGTPLGRSGNTGNSTGPHLHFVVQRNVGLALESIPYEFAQPVQNLPNFAVGGN